MNKLIALEIQLRDSGKTGALGNIPYLVLLCLAYSNGIGGIL